MISLRVDYHAHGFPFWSLKGTRAKAVLRKLKNPPDCSFHIHTHCTHIWTIRYNYQTKYRLLLAIVLYRHLNLVTDECEHCKEMLFPHHAMCFICNLHEEQAKKKLA